MQAHEQELRNRAWRSRRNQATTVRSHAIAVRNQAIAVEEGGTTQWALRLKEEVKQGCQDVERLTRENDLLRRSLHLLEASRWSHLGRCLVWGRKCLENVRPAGFVKANLVGLLDETRRYRTSGFLRLLNCIQRDARANVCPAARKMLMALPPGISGESYSATPSRHNSIASCSSSGREPYCHHSACLRQSCRVNWSEVRFDADSHNPKCHYDARNLAVDPYGFSRAMKRSRPRIYVSAD